MLGKIKKLIRKTFGGRAAHLWRSFWDRKEIRRALTIHGNLEQKQFPTKVAIIFIGTYKYISFFPRYYTTLKKYFLPKTKKDFFVFTDRTDYEFLKGKKDVVVVPVKHEKFPYINLHKFKFINKAASKLEKYSHIVFIDADMYAASLTTEKEFFSHNKPIFAVQHYNFVKKTSPEQFEQNPESLASVKSGDDLSTYWQACFWGGKSDYFLKLTKELEEKTDVDVKKNIIALWWDESFLNKYLVDHKKEVHTVDPSYAWPSPKIMLSGFKKRIIHVDENPPEARGGQALKMEIRKTGLKLPQGW